MLLNRFDLIRTRNGVAICYWCGLLTYYHESVCAQLYFRYFLVGYSNLGRNEWWNKEGRYVTRDFFLISNVINVEMDEFWFVNHHNDIWKYRVVYLLLYLFCITRIHITNETIPFLIWWRIMCKYGPCFDFANIYFWQSALWLYCLCTRPIFTLICCGTNGIVYGRYYKGLSWWFVYDVR